MTFKEFIENHIRVAPKGENIKLTSAQYALIEKGLALEAPEGMYKKGE